MFFQSLLGAALALTATANPIREQQPVLDNGFKGQQADVIKEFVFFFFSRLKDRVRLEH